MMLLQSEVTLNYSAGAAQLQLVVGHDSCTEMRQQM